MNMSSSLESLKYSRGYLSVIDQLKLPHELEYIHVSNSTDAWNVIRTMQVRGAPLIAITAALGLAVEAENRRGDFKTALEAADFLLEQMQYLRTSRPTAVNLFVATDELSAQVRIFESEIDATADSVLDKYITAAEKMMADDVATNKAIGAHGAKRILEIVNRPKIRVLTICNTGSLATAGYGTALGVVRSLHEMGKLEHVYACETRPYNQGARLTAFEIVQDKLPGTLIADSMASALMSVKGIDCVIVGADRVAANGDTANKIGTYQLAIAAKYHNVPFFAAVPTTTLDLSMASGAEIHVEERPAEELTTIFGRAIAPVGINAWNPSFDVTPCSLIRGIITELGVIEAPSDAGADGIIPIAHYLLGHAQHMPTLIERAFAATIPTAAPAGYVRMDEPKIGAYLVANELLSSLLDVEVGSDASQLKIAEIGDGNINFVYIVEGPTGRKLIIKQALPYVRCVGESWPMSLRRAYFETAALIETRRLTDGKFVPEVYHFDSAKSLIVMRFIEEPHIILRYSLMQKQRVTSFAADIGEYMAKTLFGSSGLALDGGTLRAKIAHWSQNSALCALTEKVVFTDPYAVVDHNRWTVPQLDNYGHGIKKDSELKLAAAYHKSLFLTSAETLLHGDLHTGSWMVKQDSTFMIDPEFAFYGPMGFDVGAILSNLFLSYFSFVGRDADYAEWILQQVVIVVDTFTTLFLQLWTEHNHSETSIATGEIYRSSIFTDELLNHAQNGYMAHIWRDSLGFAGMKILRRVVGISHVADLESIENPDVRAGAEKRALLFARKLIVTSYTNRVAQEGISSVHDLINAARVVFVADPAEEWPGSTTTTIV